MDGDEKYDGILHTGQRDDHSPSGANNVVLKMVRSVVGPHELVKPSVDRCRFDCKKVVSIVIKDVDLYDDERTIVARSVGTGLLADTEIEVSGRGAGAERELISASAWLGEGTSVGQLEDDEGGCGRRVWDQFAVNERLGARTTYSDDLYTTKLSDKKFTAEQLAVAARLAKEIESGGSTNSHVLEERGLKDLHEAEDDLDEEAKYSMVLDPGRGRLTGESNTTCARPSTVMMSASSTAVASTIAGPPSSVPPDLQPGAAPPTALGVPLPALSTSVLSASAFPTSKPSVLRSKLSASAKSFVPGKVSHGTSVASNSMDLSSQSRMSCTLGSAPQTSVLQGGGMQGLQMGISPAAYVGPGSAVSLNHSHSPQLPVQQAAHLQSQQRVGPAVPMHMPVGGVMVPVTMMPHGGHGMIGNVPIAQHGMPHAPPNRVMQMGPPQQIGMPRQMQIQTNQPAYPGYPMSGRH